MSSKTATLRLFNFLTLENTFKYIKSKKTGRVIITIVNVRHNVGLVYMYHVAEYK